jgi:hypothetical protein
VSRRPLGIAALALAGLGTAAAAEPLTLQIRNDTTAPLRCVLLLAHWYSEALDPVAPGGSVGLDLESGLPDGTVVRRNSLGRAMAVEGLYCLSGAADRPERADLPLDALRRARGPLPVACRLDPHLACAVAKP